MTPWFTEQEMGLIGGLAGTGVGFLGGLFGALAGILAPRGRGRALVQGVGWLGVVIGLASIVFGIAALIDGQPWFIWYAGLMLGVLSTCIFGVFTVWLIPKIYSQAESRRMDAAELRAS